MTNIKQHTQNKRNKIILFLMAIIFVISFFSFLPGQIALAEELANTTSPVLEDLQKDENFKIEDYPSITPTKKEDYTIKVIQIAESTDGEILIYIYMPTARTKKLELTTISVSTALDDKNPDFHLYNLELQNSNEVFYKYCVKNLKASNDIMRKYSISEIHRKFDKDIDDKSAEGQVISEKTIDISQKWTAMTIEGKVFYNNVTIDTIRIVDKYVGFVRYYEKVPSFLGLTNFKLGCDIHFVAFSTDIQIDKLLEAKVVYDYQKARCYELKNKDPRFLDPVLGEEAQVSSKQHIEYDVGHGFDIHYSCEEIQTANEFIKSENFTNAYEHGIFDVTITSNLKQASVDNIKDKQFVLRFAATAYDYQPIHVDMPFPQGPVTTNAYDYTIVDKVSILELTYEKEGTVYKLGAVDNKQGKEQDKNKPGDSDNNYDFNFKINWNRFFKSAYGIAITIVVIVICIVCFPLIIQLLVLAFNLVAWVISLPFKLIKLIFGKRRK